MKKISDEQVAVYMEFLNYKNEVYERFVIAVFRNEAWAKDFISKQDDDTDEYKRLVIDII